MKQVIDTRANATYKMISVGYLECQRSHATQLDPHDVDGCNEFMESGIEGTNMHCYESHVAATPDAPHEGNLGVSGSC